DLVVEDQLLAAADRGRVDHLPEAVPGRLAWTERARLEAADRADAAGEIALEERQVVAREAGVTPAVAERAAEGVREVPEALRAQEGVVPALVRLGLHELLAAEAGDLERQVLERAGGRVEGVVQRVARQARRHAADRARPLLDADRARRERADVVDL